MKYFSHFSTWHIWSLTISAIYTWVFIISHLYHWKKGLYSCPFCHPSSTQQPEWSLYNLIRSCQAPLWKSPKISYWIYIKIQTLYKIFKNLHHLVCLPSWPHLMSYNSSSFLWPVSLTLGMLDSFLSSGLCTGCPFSLDCSSFRSFQGWYPIYEASATRMFSPGDLPNLLHPLCPLGPASLLACLFIHWLSVSVPIY